MRSQTPKSLSFGEIHYTPLSNIQVWALVSPYKPASFIFFGSKYALLTLADVPQPGLMTRNLATADAARPPFPHNAGLVRPLRPGLLETIIVLLRGIISVIEFASFAWTLVV
jgi:hypothetical protein